MYNIYVMCKNNVVDFIFQNYGPKCNFKKQRVRCENFTGYPAFTKFIQDRFSSVTVLKGFQTVEQCSLEYTIERGASIDPHIDDCWIWGERIPTLSMLTDSTLTLRKFVGSASKYNLAETNKYPFVVRNDGTVKTNDDLEKEFRELSMSEEKKQPPKIMDDITSEARDCTSIQQNKESEPRILRIPMPRRSLLVLYGSPRYDWEHGILREDIASRRVCITYRELTPTYLSCGPKADTGKTILKASQMFWDHQSQLGHVIS